MEVGDVVIGHHMAGTIEFHRHIRGHHRWEHLPIDAIETTPQRVAGPADQMFGIVAAVEIVVGNVEVAGAGVVGEHAGADVFEF